MEQEMPAFDRDFTIGKITEVTLGNTEWYLTFVPVDGTEDNGIVIPLYSGSPAVGNTIRVYPKDLALPVRGVFVNDVKIYYRTVHEDMNYQAIESAERVKDRKEQFDAGEAIYREQITKLPQPFRDRMTYFQVQNTEFDWLLGEFELFVCEEAVRIAHAFKTPAEIRVFAQNPYGGYGDRLTLSKEHTAHSFQLAAYLARIYLESPEKIIDVPGALAQIVGSTVYGQPRRVDF